MKLPTLILLIALIACKSSSFPKLDLVFVMDTTSSMSRYIQEAKENIRSISQKVIISEKALVNFAYIAYRDHPPQDKSFITKVHDFTSSFTNMKDYVSLYNAEGGGDYPEAVTEGLYDALNSLSYRDDATKIVVLIADAPPHGLPHHTCTSQWTNGNPNGKDPIQIAKEMAKKGIILYTIGVEPQIGSCVMAIDFFAGLSKITDGRYLPLTDAKLLTDVIIGSAAEEISISKLEKNILEEVKKLREIDPNKDIDVLRKEVTEKLKKQNIKMKVNQLDDIYDGTYDETNIIEIASSESLQEAKSKLKILKQPERKDSSEQYSSYYEEDLDADDVGRAMDRLIERDEL